MAGVYSTTNSELNNISERYLVEYMIWKLEKRDANDSSQELNQELKDIEQEIQDSYAMGEADVEFPAILDSNYIGNSGWGY